MVRMSLNSSARMRKAQIEVILAALAFAASVPANKLLLAADVAPLALSGVLYMSAGTLCAGLAWLSGIRTPMADGNAVRGAEWVWLLGAVLSGGVLAPLLLFLGLREVSGHVAGLLLNFEAVFTVGLGVLLSGEYLGRRGWLGALAILVGAVLLSFPHAEAASIPTRWTGIALVVGACALWGLDNNLTQRVSLRDARQIVAIKGLAGGITSLLLASAFGGFGHWNAGRLLAALAVGGVSFGLSIVLFVRGLRHLGVIQTGMLFALAPGFAAILSLALLHETLAAGGLLALASMTAGALLLATDRHEHLHEHEALEHAHEHVHDEHHQHEHTPTQLAQAPHAHWHRHEAMTHRHPHVHDTHHRHRH
jgi:drug/metabolite transporter (DMT)-like permease